MEGEKYDQKKLRWSLLPIESVEEIIKVLEHGALKYEDHNWMKVENSRERYYNACIRHLTAWFKGEKNDKESNLNHLAHAGCCVLFLLWFDLKGTEKH